MFDWIPELIGNIFDFILSLFSNIFFFVFQAIGAVCDILQAIFRAFAGLGSSAVTDGIETDNTILLVRNATVSNILISMIILALLLLIITTGIAVVKTEFNGLSEKGGNSKDKVIGTALKSLGNIIAVPLVAIFSILAVNAVLRAVDSITSGGNDVLLSSQMFVACAYDANYLRVEDTFDGFNGKSCADYCAERYSANSNLNTFGLNFNDYAAAAGANSTSDQAEKYALIVDYLFKHNVEFGSGYKSASNNDKISITGTQGAGDSSAYYIYRPKADFFDFIFNENQVEREVKFTINNKSLVKTYYDLSRFNILVALVAIVIVAYNLVLIIIGCIKRMFAITMLFIISPPIAALTPLDGGNSMKNWRGEFIKNLLSLFGPVVAINLFFIVLPLINEIDFFGTAMVFGRPLSSYPGVESLAEVLITLTGVTFIKELSSTIGKLIGGGDSLSDGSSAIKDVKQNIGATMAAGKMLGAAAAMPVKAVGSGAYGALTARGEDGGKATAKDRLKAFGMSGGESLLKSSDKLASTGVDAYNKATGSQIKISKKSAHNAFEKMAERKEKMQAGALSMRASFTEDKNKRDRLDAAIKYHDTKAKEHESIAKENDMDAQTRALTHIDQGINKGQKHIDRKKVKNEETGKKEWVYDGSKSKASLVDSNMQIASNTKGIKEDTDQIKEGVGNIEGEVNKVVSHTHPGNGDNNTTSQQGTEAGSTYVDPRSSVPRGEDEE